MNLLLGKIYPIALFLLGVFPLLAEAQTPQPSQINNIITTVTRTAQNLIGLLFVFASVVFLWGMVLYIARADDETARKKAKGVMTWGIVGMAVMASGWGIASLLVKYFGVGGSGGLDVTPTRILPRGTLR